MPLNRVLVAALAVQVPDRILRAQGQNPKRKMSYGKTCYIVQNAAHLVPVRQMWGILRLTPVWKRNIETTPFTRSVSSIEWCGAIRQVPLNVCTNLTEVTEGLHSVKLILNIGGFCCCCCLLCGLCSGFIRIWVLMSVLWLCLSSFHIYVPELVDGVLWVSLCLRSTSLFVLFRFMYTLA